MLNSLADSFARSTVRRHLLFLGAALFTIAFVGYYVGTFDQVVHIPFLKKYADPTLFPNDPFFELRFQHYSYFWFLFLPFYKLGLLEIAMFVAHVFATYFTFWALWALSDLLFANALASLFTVVVFALPHIGFAGFPVIEFSLLNRTFVLPFLLWAILLFLRGKYLWAFALAGVMYNLHVVSVNFVMAMFLFDSVFEWRKVEWRNILFGLLLFVICASPVLIWKFGTSRADLSANRAWFDVISRGTLYNLFYLIAPYPHIILVTLSGLGAWALFLVARLRNPAPAYDRTVTNFVYATLIILGVQVITAQWYPATLIVQSQIIRAGLFILIFGYLYFAHYVVQQYQSGAAAAAETGLLAVATVASPPPPLPLIIWAIQRLVRSDRWRTALAVVSFVTLFAGSVVIAFRYHIWAPGIHIFPQQSAWYQAQVCARDNTPKDALFITPPEKWWLYESDWRVFSERSTVVTHSELLEAAFAPEYIDYWLPRFNALAPGALEKFAGDFFANQRTVAAAFYSLKDSDFQRLAAQYGASYLVVEKPHTYNFPAMYENKGFVIYSLKPTTTQDITPARWSCPADGPVTITSAP